MLFPGAKDGNRRCREVSYVLHLCYIKEKLEPYGGLLRDGSVVWGLRGQSERFFDNYLQTNSFRYGFEQNNLPYKMKK